MLSAVMGRGKPRQDIHDTLRFAARPLATCRARRNWLSRSCADAPMQAPEWLVVRWRHQRRPAIARSSFPATPASLPMGWHQAPAGSGRWTKCRATLVASTASARAVQACSMNGPVPTTTRHLRARSLHRAGAGNFGTVTKPQSVRSGLEWPSRHHAPAVRQWRHPASPYRRSGGQLRTQAADPQTAAELRVNAAIPISSGCMWVTKTRTGRSNTANNWRQAPRWTRCPYPPAPAIPSRKAHIDVIQAPNSMGMRNHHTARGQFFGVTTTGATPPQGKTRPFLSSPLLQPSMPLPFFLLPAGGLSENTRTRAQPVAQGSAGCRENPRRTAEERRQQPNARGKGLTTRPRLLRAFRYWKGAAPVSGVHPEGANPAIRGESLR